MFRGRAFVNVRLSEGLRPLYARLSPEEARRLAGMLAAAAEAAEGTAVTCGWPPHAGGQARLRALAGPSGNRRHRLGGNGRLEPRRPGGRRSLAM